MTYKIHHFKSPRGCQSYLIVDQDSKEAVIIDPSIEIIDEYYDFLDNNQEIDLQNVLETHTHADHVSAHPELKEKYGVQLMMCEKSPSKRKDIALEDGDEIVLGKTLIKVMHTPGHTNESITFVLDGAIFTGDTLLLSGTGRTDFQLGNSEDLYNSLQLLLDMPDETVVYVGHEYKGRDPMTLGEIRVINERIQLDRDEFIARMNNHKPDLPELFSVSINENSK